MTIIRISSGMLKIILSASVFWGFGILSGCDITDSGSDSEVSFQMKIKEPNPYASIAPASGSNIASEHSENEMELDEVKFFVEELELDGTNGTVDFEAEELNDFIANVPLDGSPLNISRVEIPDGLYDEFEIEFEKPDDDIEVTDGDFRDETGAYSLVVKGTFNDEEFRFRSTEDFEIELDLDPPVEFADGSHSILVLEIDVNHWFRDDAGLILDPKDPDNLETINENIENSFEAIEESYDD